MKIIEKIKLKFQKEFPQTIKRMYLFIDRDDYCKELWDWKNIDWNKVGQVIPMLKKGNKVAYYSLTKSYYTLGGSHSDWAMGDDGKSRDFKLHHIK